MWYTNKYNFGEKTRVWNPWRGCFQVSEACRDCYINSLNTFEDYYSPFPFTGLETGTVITVGLQSDFFLEEADKYRRLAGAEIRKHSDLIFLIITKRVDRIASCLPMDWGDGGDNVIIDVTTENQKRADERLPILLDLPLKHRGVACSPLLGPIDLRKYLSSGKIEHVEALGEKSYHMPARPMRYEGLESLSNQCIECTTRFSVLYIGHNCVLPGGTVIKDHCACFHSELADSLNLSYYRPVTFKLANLEITY